MPRNLVNKEIKVARTNRATSSLSNVGKGIHKPKWPRKSPQLSRPLCGLHREVPRTEKASGPIQSADTPNGSRLLGIEATPLS